VPEPPVMIMRLITGLAWTPVSDLPLACLGEVGLGLLPLLVVPTTGSDGYDPGHHSVRGAAVRRSARHRLQRRPVGARERIDQYMDASGWDGTRITQNLRTWISRS
jgi:hypothetical protein